ncbi:MAG: ribokinase [Anaerolineaceae bacterium]
MKKITVIGSLNLDLVVQVARIPDKGETLRCKQFHMIPGGKGGNQAVAAHHAGADVQLIGCVGKDSFGTILTQSISANGVDTSALQVITDQQTGTAIVLVDETGDNRIIINSAANQCVTPDLIDSLWYAVRDSSFILLQHEIPLEGVKHIILRAHTENIPIVLNTAPFFPVPKEVLQKVNVLIANEIEAGGLCGFQVEDTNAALRAAKILHEVGVKTVIITLGALGAVLQDDNGALYQPGCSVKVVDTTAAGDTFIGSFATAFAETNNNLYALQYASSAATLTVTKIGAQSSIPTKVEVISFMAELPNPIKK